MRASCELSDLGKYDVIIYVFFLDIPSLLLICHYLFGVFLSDIFLLECCYDATIFVFSQIYFLLDAGIMYLYIVFLRYIPSWMLV